MPVQTTARPFAAPMPSFMSVFGEETNERGLPELPDRHALSSQNEGIKGRPATSGNIVRGINPQDSAFAVFHQHRGSTSTSASESTDSSPTTTISTIDSSSMTEPSPGPSPESPYSKASPSSFVADLRPRNERSKSEQHQAPFFELQRPTTPAKKARNLKNLAVNTSSSLSLGRAISTAALPIAPKQDATASAPSSPSFVKPPTPPRRKPGNLGLTIKTNGNLPTRLAIPPTPSFKRPNMLRHFQSSPSLPLCSPSVAPEGGMQLPRLQKPTPLGFAEIPMEEQEEEQEPNFDVPQSREEKPAAYPNGPICIYESGVYLYFEPTAEQASTFDVIMNVASEVKNPFEVNPDDPALSPDILNPDRDAYAYIRPDRNTVVIPVEKELGAVQGSVNTTEGKDDTPTTPKATPVIEKSLNSNKPEYIHIPWEHNTDIVPDLYNLVKVIDECVQKKKTVLVHCQCGVSRSASLIVAYGIYKNPGISVQEAYDAVKKRSKWIGPNMNLIMQLQEFRNGLLKANGEQSLGGRLYSRGLPRKLSPNLNSSTDRRASPFEGDATPGSRTPRTAPLPPEDSAAQRASTGNMAAISPGPLSAPSGFQYSHGFRRSWDSSQSNYEIPAKPMVVPAQVPYVDPAGHIVPVVPAVKTKPPSLMLDKRNDSTQVELSEAPRIPNFSRQLPFRLERQWENDQHMTEISAPSIMSPRSEEFHMTPLKPAQANASDPFNLLSPHSTEFASNNPYKPKEIEMHFDLASPRSTEFHMSGMKPEETNDPFGLMSPVKTEFSNNPFRPTAERTSSQDHAELLSPRSTEFHMTALQPTEAPNDPFGMMSPLSGEFPNNSFDSSPRMDTGSAFSSRPMHPLHSIQPPQAQRTGLGSIIASAQQSNMPSISQMTSQSPWNPAPAPSQPNTHSAQPAGELKAPNRSLRAKFSSPSISTQIRLHDLQNEIESHLPRKSPNLGPQADDMDALMSPRVTEFTKNPFHFELPTIGHSGSDKLDIPHPDQHSEGTVEKSQVDGWVTPKPGEKDPRSPPLQGVSPITRNIWDVL